MVAGERRGRLAAQLALLLGVAEAAAPPAGLQQPEQLGQAAGRMRRARRRGSARAPGGRGSRSAGAASAPGGSGTRGRTCTSAGRCGRCRCRSPTAPRPRRGGAGTAPATARRGRRSPGRAGARRARRPAGSRPAAEDSKISRCSAVTAWRIRELTSRRDSATLWPVRPAAGDQRRQLEQLQVAHDRVRDVEVGVEAQLAQPPAGARGPLQQLVAQQAVGGVQRLGGAEQLLLALLPHGAEQRRAPSRAPPAGPAAPRDRRRGGTTAPGATRARLRATYSSWASATWRVSSVSGGSSSDSSESGIALGGGHGHAGVQPDHVDVVGLQAARSAAASAPGPPRHRPARAPPARAGRSRRPRRSTARTRGAWPAACASRRRRPARRSWPARAAAPPHLTVRRTAAGGAGRAVRSAGGRTGRGGWCRSRSCRPCRA